MSGSVERYRARWVLPVDAPPLANGVLEIENGRLTAVHDRDEPRAVDLGNVALLPGLVNCHTHLEFSEFAEPLPATGGFANWLRRVVASRRDRPDSRKSVAIGLDELVHCGTSVVGEIATAGWDSAALSDNSPCCVAFHESIGLAAERHDEQLDLARRFLAAPPCPGLLRGLSPHAPYSVHPDLYRDLVRLAVEDDVPLAVHLAETREERQLLAAGDGPLRGLLEELGAWDGGAIPSGSRPLDYLEPLDRLDRALVIHGNFLDDEEIAWLGHHRQVTVVYCPRTHDYFGHPLHPWRRLLDAGASVALGTDSRTSNPDLSVFNEVQFLARRDPDADPAELLELATLAGARALGLDADYGSLAEGKVAEAVIVELGGEGDPLSDVVSRGRIARRLGPGLPPTQGSLHNGTEHPG